MAEKIIETWVFELRMCVDPKAAMVEWCWVVDWVRDQGLQGKVFARRTVEMEGENSKSTFTIVEGRTEVTKDSNYRNL